MKIPSIETPHLLLRPWCPEDADAWCDIVHEDGILRYFPNQTPPSPEKAEAYIAHHLGHWASRGYGHWAIVTPEDGRVVGWNGLEYLPELDETEVAYLLSTRVWGHGYATEAARAAIQFGFETARLAQTIGLVHPENIASIRVLEKCGLRYAEWSFRAIGYSGRPTKPIQARNSAGPSLTILPCSWYYSPATKPATGWLCVYVGGRPPACQRRRGVSALTNFE